MPLSSGCAIISRKTVVWTHYSYVRCFWGPYESCKKQMGIMVKLVWYELSQSYLMFLLVLSSMPSWAEWAYVTLWKARWLMYAICHLACIHMWQTRVESGPGFFSGPSWQCWFLTRFCVLLVTSGWPPAGGMNEKIKLEQKVAFGLGIRKPKPKRPINVKNALWE